MGRSALAWSAVSQVPRLRVAMLAPIAWRVPPRHYGPWEQFVSLLTEGLVRLGVDVTLFATRDSLTRARLVGTAPTGYAEDEALDAKVWECLHIAEVFERAGDFDLIHNSFDFLPLTYSGLVETPVVTTIHGFSSATILPVFERYNGDGHYVAISDADRHPSLRYAATIHHGIEMQRFEVGSGSGGYLLFFGRIHPDKGTAEAIETAAAAGRPLVLAGIVQDRDYFEREVEPRHRRQPRAVRGVGRPGGAEPAARRCAGAASPRRLRGAVRIQRRRGDGMRDAGDRHRPGVDARDRPRRRRTARSSRRSREAVEAVEAVGTLDRQGVRASVVRRFDADRMVRRLPRRLPRDPGVSTTASDG